MADESDLDAIIGARIAAAESRIRETITGQGNAQNAALAALAGRVAALEARGEATPAPAPETPPAPAPEPPAPVPTPAETAEQIARRLIAAVWAANPGATPLPAGAMTGWVAHFAPLVEQFTEDALRAQMLETARRDGWIKTGAPVPAPSPGGAAAVMINHMGRTTDVALRNVNPDYGWKDRGYCYQGSNPDFRHTPGWFGRKDLGVGKLLLPWHVLFEGTGLARPGDEFEHLATALLFRIGGNWEVADIFRGRPGGHLQAQDGNYVGGGLGSPPWQGNVMALRSGVNFHGYSRRIPLPAAYEAVQVQVAVRFEGAGEWALHASGDYYLRADGDQVGVPGFAISRPVRLARGKNIVFATSLTDRDICEQEPGAGISAAELAANPPPVVV